MLCQKPVILDFPKFSILSAKIIIARVFLWKMVFWKEITFCCIATEQSKKSSFESKYSSKSKINLDNEASAEDKFQNAKETKLQKF